MPKVEILLQVPEAIGLVKLGHIELANVPRVGEIIHVAGHQGTVGFPVREIAYCVPEIEADAVAVLGLSTSSAAKNIDSRTEIEGWREIFQQANSYNSVMMLAGYAGLFAIWTFVKEYIGRLESLTVAKYMGISLIAFVLYEIFGMLARSTSIIKWVNSWKPIGMLGPWLQKIHYILWFVAFPLSTYYGIGAAIILFSEISRNIPTP